MNPEPLNWKEIRDFMNKTRADRRAKYARPRRRRLPSPGDRVMLSCGGAFGHGLFGEVVSVHDSHITILLDIDANTEMLSVFHPDAVEVVG